ncbi:MAG: fatty acid desaturase family protein [Deltaproteobacteria bacterium]|nr:fatty acid desaturase family protein [Deltaproteobacteria bacterium]MBW2418016.1 fatty acid desaturase family protein [Deltaproteobacteria bacterium]
MTTRSSNEDAAAPAGAEHWREALSREEIQELLRFDDRRGAWIVLSTWGLIFGAMALVAWWPGFFTVVVALCVIGAQQLGLAVVMHDAAHRSMFSERSVNDWVGSWLAAYPTWQDVERYRPYHLRHHAKNWTDEDPDVDLARPFPITRVSMWRKVGRDLSGRTGLKFARFSWRRDSGGEGPWQEQVRKALATPRFRGMLISNAVLLGVLSLAGHPALYLLWVAAWFTTNTLVTRIRAIAEHSMVPDPANPLLNTRTTRVSWWERIFLAPNYVNFHLEHHLLMTVPPYNLPRMHALLRERGVLDHALLAGGYLEVLREASSAPAA